MLLSGTIVTAMGIVQYEELKLRQQEIEVKALIALMKYGRSDSRRSYAEKKLCEYAFPEDHINEKDSVIEKWL